METGTLSSNVISCRENALKFPSATAQSRFFSQTIQSVLFEEILLEMIKYQLFVILFLIGTIFVCENVETDAKATQAILERNARNIQQRRGKVFSHQYIVHAGSRNKLKDGWMFDNLTTLVGCGLFHLNPIILYY